MKRANKHVKGTAKPVQQRAFKRPAQELQEFKAKVLALKHGPVIWCSLSMEESDDNMRILLGWVEEVLAPFPALLSQFFPNTLIDTPTKMAGARFLADRLLRQALHEVGSKVDELWPEYRSLLELNPDELKTYRDRYNQNRLPPDFAERPRELRQGPGAPRKQAARDAQIAYMKDKRNYTFGQIARKLEIPRQSVSSAYYRMKGHTPTRCN
jgi:hypothetical protein